MPSFPLTTVVLLALAGLGYSAQRTTYKGAVYQHKPLPEIPGRIRNAAITPYEEMLLNLVVLNEQTRLASEQGVDIIVFPEFGIMRGESFSREEARAYLQTVPDPTQVNWIPCDDPFRYNNNTQVLAYLSCMARNHSVVVVANLGDMHPCNSSLESSCPSDNFNQYNTDVVFGKDGKLLARYHKYNLFIESPPYNKPPAPEYVTFTTDFGTFGIFTCFDFMFKDPSIVLVDRGVKNFVVPTEWVDELPFLTAVQIQQSWAHGNGVNLLAANLHNPAHGALGSGIYSGNLGALNYTFDPNSGPQLLTADLPINPNQRTAARAGSVSNSARSSGVRPQPRRAVSHKILHMSLAEFTLQELSESSGNKQSCHTNICCNLDYELQRASGNETYFLAAYSGIRDLILFRWAWQVCAVVMCTSGQDISTCVPDSSQTGTTFKSLNLNGNFTTSYIYPNILTTDLQLVPGNKWQYTKTPRSEVVRNDVNNNVVTSRGSVSQSNTAQISINSNVNELLVAQIIGRNYDLD